MFHERGSFGAPAVGAPSVGGYFNGFELRGFGLTKMADQCKITGLKSFMDIGG